MHETDRHNGRGLRCHCSIVILFALLIAPRCLGSVSLTGVPDYRWYYGCSPTSAGMLVGYWDGLPGYGNLFDGDASVISQATKDMIASPSHISDPRCVRHTANCIADFMKTGLDGLTDYSMIGKGLHDYIEWDNPNTAIDEGYDATVATHSISALGGDMSWDLYANEIDAGRPVLLNVVAYYNSSIYGHSVVGYGYQDDMFTLTVLRDDQPYEVTVPGFAVRDTWPAGTAQSSWYGAGLSTVVPVIDDQGVEWWPWLDVQAVPSSPSLWSWMIYQGVTVDIAVPEPTTLSLLGIALLGRSLLPRRRQTL